MGTRKGRWMTPEDSFDDANDDEDHECECEEGECTCDESKDDFDEGAKEQAAEDRLDRDNDRY